MRTCPYKKVFFNTQTLKSEKCIFCYPRIEGGTANACAVQCPGRVRHVGFVSDPESSDVYRLAKDLQVALPLHPEYETGPNVYYVPPFSGPSQVNPDGSLINVDRIPIELPAAPVWIRMSMLPSPPCAMPGLTATPDGILAILSSNDRYDIPVGG